MVSVGGFQPPDWLTPQLSQASEPLGPASTDVLVVAPLSPHRDSWTVMMPPLGPDVPVVLVPEPEPEPESEVDVDL
jgi:hypothetical protein